MMPEGDGPMLILRKIAGASRLRRDSLDQVLRIKACEKSW
jgi:hypothetical protein